MRIRSKRSWQRSDRNGHGHGGPPRFTTCQIALGVSPSPRISPARWTWRKILSAVIPTDVVHWSIAAFAQVGTGTVRMCFPVPIRSAMIQWILTLLKVVEPENRKFSPP